MEAVERAVGAFQFNTAIADEMLRLPVGGNAVTVRWLAPPVIYVDVESLEPHQSQVFYPAAGACQTPVGRLLDAIRDSVSTRAPELIGGRLALSLVEVRPSSAMPPMRTPGVIRITGYVAPGNLAGYGDPFFNSNYEIISAEIGLSTSNGAGGAGNVDRSTTTHELGHALGRAHSTAPSVMGGGGTGTCLPTLNDRMYGEYHYRRPPGTRSPDDTTQVETIRGRVSSIHVLVVTSGPQIGDAEASVVASVIGIQGAVVSGGLLTLAGLGLIAVALPEFGRLDMRRAIADAEAEAPTTAAAAG